MSMPSVGPLSTPTYLFTDQNDVQVLSDFRTVLKNGGSYSESLTHAIDVAVKLFFAQEEGSHDFFKDLIELGKEEDVEKIKPFLLKVCNSDQIHTVCEFCYLILQRPDSEKNLVSIPLEVAATLCKSDTQSVRTQGLDLFWHPLDSAPEKSVEATLEAILMESKRKDPSGEVLKRLKQIIDHESEFIQKYMQQNSLILFQALNDLSVCNNVHLQKGAEKLREALEQKLKTFLGE